LVCTCRHDIGVNRRIEEGSLLCEQRTRGFVVGAKVLEKVNKLRVLHCSERPARGDASEAQQDVQTLPLSVCDLRLVHK